MLVFNTWMSDDSNFKMKACNVLSSNSNIGKIDDCKDDKNFTENTAGEKKIKVAKH